MNEAPSEIGCRSTLNDGTMVFTTSTRSEEWTLAMSSGPNTSTGTAESAAVRGWLRVPMVTTTSSASSSKFAFCSASSAATVTVVAPSTMARNGVGVLMVMHPERL